MKIDSFNYALGYIKKKGTECLLWRSEAMLVKSFSLLPDIPMLPHNKDIATDAGNITVWIIKIMHLWVNYSKIDR